MEVLRLLLLSVKYVFVRLLLLLGYKGILRRNTWLVSEKRTEARDNGYHMFAYLRNSTIKEDVYYSIVYGKADSQRVQMLGNVVEYNSFLHIALYLGSKYLLYCQIDSRPYEDVRGIHYLDFLRRKDQLRTYLTHGICKDNVPSSYDYRLGGYHLFICGAKPEYNYYKSLYNYPDKNIALTGLCRFDALYSTVKEKSVLIMPTFRDWLRTDNSTKEEASESEKQLMLASTFYSRYSSLLKNETLLNFLSKNKARLFFYLHYTIQPYISLFKEVQNNALIKICGRNEYDVQDLLKSSSILITDYSSVAFDFAYMGKPLAYYHFDYEEYRSKHYKEGFFNYERGGLGPVFSDENAIVDWLQQVVGIEEGDWNYLNRRDDFFAYLDKNNCYRVYKAILEL